MTNEEAISLLCGLHDYHNEEAHELESAKTVMEKLAYAQEKERVKALDAAINAVEKAEKYRWHDLRKNPDDMPEEDGLYWIHVICGSGKHAEGEFEYKCHDGYFRTSWNFNVIGWKRVEPFEGDGE